MLPPGHIAAGFLVAEAILKFANPPLPQADLVRLAWWGMFFGFVPDLDNFLAFFKVRSFYYYQKDNSIHRQFLSHVPLLWLVAGLLIYWLAGSLYWKYVGLMVWAGSWSHFALDSLEYGVMWLWPFNRELWALKNRGVKKQINVPNFAGYWLAFLRLYATRLTCYAELLILAAAALVYTHLHI